ncbi:MAG: arsenic efflux protein [Clostridia bacterium]|nr:arsenic efflux protein [Clostridia bacterium]
MTIELFFDVLLETLLDFAKILPILYLTYLLIELIEKKASGRLETALKKGGRFGPVFGSLLGLIPQCGFSSAAASFFAAGTITAGTLLAVFLSTSDEMLPILLTSRMPARIILIILGIKLVSGMLVGFLTDLIWRRKNHHPDESDKAEHDGADSEHEHDEEHEQIHELCERAHCHCHEGQNIFLAALKHTLWIGGLILAVSFVIGLTFAWIGEDNISQLFVNVPLVREVIAALIGLIPNCAASVLITDLFVSGVIGLGPLISGLLVNAGVGLLVLYRSSRRLKQNILITVILVLSGILLGFAAGFIPLAL